MHELAGADVHDPACNVIVIGALFVRANGVFGKSKECRVGSARGSFVGRDVCGNSLPMPMIVKLGRRCPKDDADG